MSLQETDADRRKREQLLKQQAARYVAAKIMIAARRPTNRPTKK